MQPQSGIESIKEQLRELSFASPGNSGRRGVPYHEIYFSELHDIAPLRGECDARVRAILSSTAVNNKVVFDLGCNVGYFCFALAAHGARTVGIDYDADSVALCESLKKHFQVTNAQFIRAPITNESLAALVAQYGAPDVILLNSVMHWLLHAHDGMAEVVRLLSVLLTDTKEQVILYEPSSTGVALYPETLCPHEVTQFLATLGGSEVSCLGEFPAQNARQSRRYYRARRCIPELLAHAAKVVRGGSNAHGPWQVQRRFAREGKTIAITQEYVIKGASSGVAKKLLENERVQIARVAHSRHVPTVVASGEVEGQLVIVYARERAAPLSSSWVSSKMVPVLTRECAELLAHLSSAGVSHNDIQEENLLWSSAEHRLVLIDFEYATYGAGGRESLCRLVNDAIDSARVRASCDTLERRWRAPLPLGSPDFDRYSAKQLLYLYKDRPRYIARKVRMLLLAAATKCYRWVVPQSFRRLPRTEPLAP